MSIASPSEDDFQPDEFRAGRRSRFRIVQTGQWALLMSGLSDAGYRLYSLMRAHVSTERGDDVVWPSQQSLADMLDKRPEAVSRVLNKELIPFGLVDVDPQRYGTNNSRKRNVYTVHEEPPPGWEGYASIQEWYAAQKNKPTGRPGDAKNRVSGDLTNRVSGHPTNRVGNYTKVELHEEGKTGGSAGGQSAGGLARAGAREAAADSAADAEGGTAADSKNVPAQRGKSSKRGSGVVKTRQERPVAGEEEIWRLLAPMLEEAGQRPGTRPKTLRRAVRAFLGHDTDARPSAFRAHPRTAEHAVLRLNRGWYGARGPERAARSYTAPDRIQRPIGYLVTLLSYTECIRPECESGILLTTGAECTECDARAAERAANALRERWVAGAPPEAPEGPQDAPGVPDGVDWTDIEEPHDAEQSAEFGQEQFEEQSETGPMAGPPPMLPPVLLMCRGHDDTPCGRPAQTQGLCGRCLIAEERELATAQSPAPF
ncbi:hypothetical protein ABZ845_30865 [Streptomyces sp. NPDC047022]|uniref:hypothetical protein n=1 Tax=Streptomyces sp. NPDC047022 TaxID=3155737 RepID=UPI0033F8082A